MTKKQKNILFLILIVLLFVGQFFFISPIGEFALNDDWVHTDSIKHWADTGNFRLMPYAGPTFYVPILYGTALTKIFGFSFSLLRISTLSITICLLLTVYYLLLKLTSKPALAFCSTLLLWLNPIFYNLSFTFMTDIPALFFLIISIYFYYQAFLWKKPKYIFWGSVFAIIGFYTRQTNILILGAAGLVALKEIKKFKFHHLIWSFGIPLAIGGAIYSYLTIYQLLPESTNSHFIEGVGRTLGHIKWWLWYIPMYLGLFTLPLSAGWFIKNKRHWKNKKLWIICSAIVGLAILIRQIWHLQFPYIGNTISIYGLGSIKNTIAGNPQLLASSWVWGILTLVTSLGLSLGIYILLQKKEKGHQPINFLYLFGILYLIPLLVFESFDRYLLPLLVVVIIALLQKIKTQKFSYITAIILIIPCALYSVSQTDHYLKWNKVRWELANSVLNKGIPANQIDGGYEWDGWNDYWSSNLSGNKKGTKIDPWWIYHIFTNNTREYIISFTAFDNYEIIEYGDIESFNPNNTLYLLKKLTTNN